jgi:ubiquinone biosynthesis monooxygenase Coq7
MTKRKLSFLDQILVEADNALRVFANETSTATRPSPAQQCDESQLNAAQERHAAGLMRVNHSGEVCAQGLYRGQALTAKMPAVRKEMEQAAVEEVDHLAWCEQRLKAVQSGPSLLNPLWYAMSFSLGAGAGLLSDRLSLGFVAATEQQVCEHLESHLKELPEADQKSLAVVEEMLVDEGKHASGALRAGGLPFPSPIKQTMSLVSRIMTRSSYRF